MNEAMEIALMRQFRDGGQEAVGYIHKLYFAEIQLFAEKLTGNYQEAQDIATNSFVKLWNMREQFENQSNIRAFLYVTTRNACFDYLRAYKRHLQSHLEVVYLKLYEDETTLDESLYSQLLEKISLAIEDLPKQCGNIFKLIYFEGLSTTEIATQLGISNQTVLNQKTRALQLLRSEIIKFTLKG